MCVLFRGHRSTAALLSRVPSPAFEKLFPLRNVRFLSAAVAFLGSSAALGNATATAVVDGVTVALTAGTSGNTHPVISTSSLRCGSADAGGVGAASTEDTDSNLSTSESIAVSFSVDVFPDSLDLAGVATAADHSATIAENGVVFWVVGSNAEPTVAPDTAGVGFADGDDLLSFEAGLFRVDAGDFVALSNASAGALNLNAVSFSGVPGPAVLPLAGLGAALLLRGRSRVTG